MIRSIEYARAHRHVLEERQRIQQAQNSYTCLKPRKRRASAEAATTQAPKALWCSKMQAEHNATILDNQRVALRAANCASQAAARSEKQTSATKAMLTEHTTYWFAFATGRRRSSHTWRPRSGGWLRRTGTGGGARSSSASPPERGRLVCHCSGGACPSSRRLSASAGPSLIITTPSSSCSDLADVTCAFSLSNNIDELRDNRVDDVHRWLSCLRRRTTRRPTAAASIVGLRTAIQGRAATHGHQRHNRRTRTLSTWPNCGLDERAQGQ